MNTSTTDRPGGRRPRLSVVIASSNDGGLLARCVDALGTQEQPDDVEVIVVRDEARVAGVDRRAITERLPGLRWLDAPKGTTVPRLRGLGIAASRGELVALLEDDCMVADGWCRTALTSIQANAALGGAVEPGRYRRALDWAVYFCEYGRFMLPVPSGPGAPLTGNNVIYARWALEGLTEESRRDFREVFVHDAWQVAGVPTDVSGSLVVRNVNSWTWPDVTSVPFHHGRAYAARRFGARNAGVRAGFSLLAVGLPVIKLLRISAGTLSRRRLVDRLIVAMPFMLMFLVSWSAGEILGSLRGPGDSASHWR